MTKFYFLLFLLYNFSRVLFFIPEQGLLYRTTCKIDMNFTESFCKDLFKNEKKNINETEIHITIMANVSTISFYVNVLINVIFLLFCPILIFLLECVKKSKNDYRFLFYSGLLSKVILNVGIFLFAYFEFKSEMFIFVYLIPLFLGDDLLFFTTFNQYLSKIIFSLSQDKDNLNIKERSNFNISLISLFVGRILSYSISNIFFFTDNYILIYLILLILNIFIFICSIMIIHCVLIRRDLIIKENPIEMKVLYQQTLKNVPNILYLIKILLLYSFPPSSLIERIIFIFATLKFDWTEKHFSVYKICECMISIIILIISNYIIKKWSVSMKRSIIVSQASILFGFVILKTFEKEEMIIPIFTIFYLTVNVYNSELKRFYFKTASEENNNTASFFFSFFQNLFFTFWSLLLLLFMKREIKFENIFYILMGFESLTIFTSFLTF